MNKTSIYNANDTMQIIGKQRTNYLFYNNGLNKINQVLNAHTIAANNKMGIAANELMYDTYLLGFIQGMKYARQKAKQPHTRCKVI